MIRVYNTLTRTKEPFQTVRPGKVGIYLCGPTVYKPSHIGHMVGPVVFDAIKRYLTYTGYEVTWVINITDVDDKLIARAHERGITVAQLAEEMTADYMECLRVMGVEGVDHFPRATEYIPAMIAFIERLVEKGCAYASDGDVYFDVSRFPEYGKLSRRSLKQMQIEGGSTVERKRSGADFALWKSAKPGEPSWPSPWGPGRPGWHIECSVMSGQLLGETFDIHGGGLDLVFPHHENEIAQSEACHSKPMARYWMHNGLMQASDEVGKVGGRTTRPAEGDQEAQEAGKIAGRHGAQSFLVLLREQGFTPEQVRFFLLSTHYRRPTDFSVQRIREVGVGLEAFYRFFQRYGRITGEDFYQVPFARRRSEGELSPGGPPVLEAIAEQRNRFLDAMDDDFNTGGAVGVLFELLRRLNKFADDEKLEDPQARSAAAIALLRQGAKTLRELAATLGLFLRPVKQPDALGDHLVRHLLGLLVEIRADARKAKNFAAADKIRSRLADLGVVLEDRPGGTQWSLRK